MKNNKSKVEKIFKKDKSIIIKDNQILKTFL